MTTCSIGFQDWDATECSVRPIVSAPLNTTVITATCGVEGMGRRLPQPRELCGRHAGSASLPHMSSEHESVKVSAERWHEAQAFERETWESVNRRNGPLKLAWRMVRSLRDPRQFARILSFRDFYCGDDWNFWWMDAFEQYQCLPRTIGDALEVGCGPYTNVRLLNHLLNIRSITLADPLMGDYVKFRNTWVADQVVRGAVRTDTAGAEDLPYDPGVFDLVICINVLDHVQDAAKCIDEMSRVLRPGGHIVLGQDLTDREDWLTTGDDVGHPIRVRHETILSQLVGDYEATFERVLSREEGRAPEAHYGTLLYVGRRK